MRDSMYCSHGEFLEAIQSGQTWLSVWNSSGRMLAELLENETFRSFAKCMRKLVLEERDHLGGGNSWVSVVRSVFTNGGCFPTLRDCDRAENKIRMSPTEDCEMHAQRVYASRRSGAEKKC